MIYDLAAMEKAIVTVGLDCFIETWACSSFISTILMQNYTEFPPPLLRLASLIADCNSNACVMAMQGIFRFGMLAYMHNQPVCGLSKYSVI